MFRKLFGKDSNKKLPIEPIFPEDNFSIFKMEIDGGLAFATINTGYNNYHNKEHFSWYTQVTVNIHDKNDNGHPIDAEAEILNNLEDRITEFLKQTQTVHAVGRVTRNGERDIIFYIDKPNLDPVKSKEFFDSMNAIRPMNIIVKKDKKWSNIGAFLK